MAGDSLDQRIDRNAVSTKAGRHDRCRNQLRPRGIRGQAIPYCACRDVTARKGAERSLQDSQERFRRVLANIPDVVVLYDRDLRIRFINDATRAITGKRAVDFIGLRDEDIFPQEVCEVYLPTLREAFKTKLIRKPETDLPLPHGRVHSLRITCVPLLDKSGEVREVLAITHDFTERKMAELKILESESQYRELIEQAADGIFISDRDSKFILVNTQCCKLLGYARDELLGMNGEGTYLEEETDVTARRMSQLPLVDCEDLDDSEQHHITYRTGSSEFIVHSEPRRHQTSRSGKDLEELYRAASDEQRPVTMDFAEKILEKVRGIAIADARKGMDVPLRRALDRSPERNRASLLFAAAEILSIHSGVTLVLVGPGDGAA